MNLVLIAHHSFEHNVEYFLQMGTMVVLAAVTAIVLKRIIRSAGP